MDYIFKYCKILLPYYDDFITQNRLCLLTYCCTVKMFYLQHFICGFALMKKHTYKIVLIVFTTKDYV